MMKNYINICAYRLNAADYKILFKKSAVLDSRNATMISENDLRKRGRSLAWHEQRASRLKNFAPDSAAKTPAGQNYSGFAFHTASFARNAAVRNITQFADGTRSSAAPAGIKRPSPQEPLCTIRICR